MALTPFTLPTYSGQVLPGGEVQTGLKPPAIQQGGQYNPHAYAQADAMQALKAAFKPQAYMPWFAQQAPQADWSKTYNTGAWMPPWVMNPGNVSTRGTNLGLGGMFGYQGNYGASPGPGVGAGTWGGVPTQNPLTIHAARQGTTPWQPPTPTTNAPVTQSPFRPTNTLNPDNDIPSGWTGGGTGGYTGIPTQNPTNAFGTPVYGTPTNTPEQNYQAAAESGNPLPPPRPQNYTGASDFLDNFSFQSPANTAQTVFNEILNTYGINEAMTFALHNRGLMGNDVIESMSSLPSVDRNRIVNTYSAGTNDVGDGYNMDLSALGNPFDPTSAISRYRARLSGG